MEISKICSKINRRLLPVKVHLVLFFAALGCALPFRTVFAKQLGISATAVGVIFCAVPFLRMLTNPLFGFILDYYKRFRLTLFMIMILVALSHVAMIFIPPKTSTPPEGVNTTEGNFHSKFRIVCLNDTTPPVCDPMFIIHNEYHVRGDAIRETSNFACDVQCYDPRNDVKEKGSIQRCSAKMKFEFKVLIGASSCDNDVKFGRGRFLMLEEENSLSFDINGSSVSQLKSWLKLTPEKCFEPIQKRPFSPNADHEAEKKLSRKNLLREDDNLREFHHVRDQEDIQMPAGLDSGVRRYYTLNEYALIFFCENYVCSSQLDCETKKCSFDATKDKSISEHLTTEENEYLSSQFWCLFLLIALSNIMFNTIIFIIDVVTYELLQNRRDKYGHQRLWGTVGWGLGALAGGYINQVVTGDSGEIDYAPGFYLLAILTLIDLIPVHQLKVTDIKYSSHIWKDVCSLFSEIDIICNIVVVYFIGVLSGFIWNYQFWFMQEIGSSQTLLGLSQTFECLFELPWFIISGWIINKIGHSFCNSITLLCFGLRYLCFVFMYDPWWTLAAALFHGPTFGLFYASMTMYAKNKAPPGTEATVQSLLHLSFEGIGVASGSILGGLGLDRFGCRRSFVYAAELSFVLLFVNLLTGVLLSKTRKNTKQIKDSIPCAA